MLKENKMEGLGKQIDGNHYTSMKMQPVELAYKLYATPCFCKLAKYLTREKGDKITNLKKALHCVQLESDLRNQAYRYLDSMNWVGISEAKQLIHIFTDNPLYREALIWMWLGHWENAIEVVNNIIIEYKGC